MAGEPQSRCAGMAYKAGGSLPGGLLRVDRHEDMPRQDQEEILIRGTAKESY